MKGLILSGGKGTRLRPITFSMAKQLVPVANKPVLFYGIEAMRDAGITDVGIVVGDTAGEIERAVGDGSQFGIRVCYIRQEQPRGLADAVRTAEGFLGESPFVMYLGDNLIRSGIGGLISEFEREGPASTILLSHVPNPEEFGVAELDGECVIRLEEKPTHPKSDLALVGVYLFDSRVHDVISGLSPSKRGELEITDAIQGLIDRGLEVRSHVITGWWKDTGTVQAMLEANRLVMEGMAGSIAPGVSLEGCELEGPIGIEAGTELRATTIRGPVLIGANCRLTRVNIGPNTAIGDGCALADCSVSNSILMARSEVRGPTPPIVDSLIGSEVLVQGGDGSARLVLGDSSQVRL